MLTWRTSIHVLHLDCCVRLGYDDNIDGRVPNSFAAAAFRIGHTLLNERLNRIKDNMEESNELFLSQVRTNSCQS